MEITLSGILVLITNISAAAVFIWRFGGLTKEYSTKVEGAGADIAALEVTTDARFKGLEQQFDSLEQQFDAKIAALTGSINLMRDQHHELREHLATNYMKREEIAAMERRITENQTALRADINKLDTKIDGMQKSVLDAIAQLAARLR